jgi:hypothetical protein
MLEPQYRTLDALQLASAQAVEGEGLIFVTADSKLTTVASVVFSQVLNPEVGERGHGMRCGFLQMIAISEQFKRAAEAIIAIKHLLLATRRTHCAEAYEALAAPILCGLQERERDVLIYVSRAPAEARSELL